MDKPFQTRSETHGLRSFETLSDALTAAKEDESIWKISFTVGKEMVRLLRTTGDEWVYEPILIH